MLALVTGIEHSPPQDTNATAELADEIPSQGGQGPDRQASEGDPDWDRWDVQMVA